jgi:hypothetical protein
MSGSAALPASPVASSAHPDEGADAPIADDHAIAAQARCRPDRHGTGTGARTGTGTLLGATGRIVWRSQGSSKRSIKTHTIAHTERYPRDGTMASTPAQCRAASALLGLTRDMVAAPGGDQPCCVPRLRDSAAHAAARIGGGRWAAAGGGGWSRPGRRLAG